MGLTQEQLAEKLGVERTTVVRWERGQTRPQPWLQPKLARALQVSAENIEELLAAGGPAASPPGLAAVPRQLPAAVADFTGRAAELAALTGMLDQAGAGTVVISAIGGTAGVGKTALALHWARQIAGRFSDGQLYVNLRGYHPSGSPASAAEAIQAFLEALGVPPERIPASPGAQAALYRSLLADKRMLIVADNARDEQQVRPLLPTGPSSLVIVTSRNQLSGLAAIDGARLLTLDVLTQGEAIQLLTARLGSDRAAAEPAAIGEIASLCAHLPLALAVAAARAAARPGFRLAALAAELRGTIDRLDALDVGDPAASVRSVFSWSYQQLSGEAARMFRLLGVHPGPDIAAPAAASLAGTDEPGARRLLGQLTRDCLISEHVPGRYAFHDLFRAYAVGQANTHDSEPERIAAIGRILDHYLHTAHAAAVLLGPSAEPIALAPARPGAAPEQLADSKHALAWFEAEQHVLLAIAALAAASGFDNQAWQIDWAMVAFATTRGPYRKWVASQRTRLASAARADDTAGLAARLRIVADALSSFGDYDQVVGRSEHILSVYRRLEDRLGEARVYQALGYAAERQGRYMSALGYAERALCLYRSIGHRAAEADMLNSVGWYHCLLGDYPQAGAFCQQAIALCAEVGDRHVEGRAWASRGNIEHCLGNLGEAAACYKRALSLFREFGDRPYEADTLAHLGDIRHAAGEPSQAREAWQQALAILLDLGHPDIDTVRAKLASTNDHVSKDPCVW